MHTLTLTLTLTLALIPALNNRTNLGLHNTRTTPYSLLCTVLANPKHNAKHDAIHHRHYAISWSACITPHTTKSHYITHNSRTCITLRMSHIMPCIMHAHQAAHYMTHANHAHMSYITPRMTCITPRILRSHNATYEAHRVTPRARFVPGLQACGVDIMPLLRRNHAARVEGGADDDAGAMRVRACVRACVRVRVCVCVRV